jgi:hypothetical protein
MSWQTEVPGRIARPGKLKFLVTPCRARARIDEILYMIQQSASSEFWVDQQGEDHETINVRLSSSKFRKFKDKLAELNRFSSHMQRFSREITQYSKGIMDEPCTKLAEAATEVANSNRKRKRKCRAAGEALTREQLMLYKFTPLEMEATESSFLDSSDSD